MSVEANLLAGPDDISRDEISLLSQQLLDAGKRNEAWHCTVCSFAYANL
jgi:hypothetical protein